MSRLTLVRLAVITALVCGGPKDDLMVVAWSSTGSTQTTILSNSPCGAAVLGPSFRYGCTTLTLTGNSRQNRRYSHLLGLAKGFGDSVSKKPAIVADADADPPLKNANANSIYSNPILYDLAFGYRDFEEEVDFLLARHLDITGTAATRIVEVAAGPARHSMAALNEDQADRHTTVQDVYCVDMSPQMKEYARESAQKWFLEPTTTMAHMNYQVNDMRNFQLVPEGATVDSAWLLLGSLQHMTTNDDVIQCFQCIHKAVGPGGTLFLELPHPRETFSVVECTRNSWAIPLGSEGEDGGDPLFDDDDDDEDSQMSTSETSSVPKLKIIWGDEGDTFDPITQVRQFTISTELIGDGAVPEELSSLLASPKVARRQVVPIRLFTAQEIDALARCTGWKVVAMYGALAEGVALEDEDTAFRLVCALQK